MKSPIAPPNNAIVKPAKSFEDWQNDVLSRILQVTLNVSAPLPFFLKKYVLHFLMTHKQPESMYQQGKCVYLRGLADELIEEQG